MKILKGGYLMKDVLKLFPSFEDWVLCSYGVNKKNSKKLPEIDQKRLKSECREYLEQTTGLKMTT